MRAPPSSPDLRVRRGHRPSHRPASTPPPFSCQGPPAAWGLFGAPALHFGDRRCLRFALAASLPCPCPSAPRGGPMRRAALAAALWRPAHRSLAAVLEEAPALSDEDWKSGLEDQSSYGALSNGSGTYDFDDLGEQFDVGHLLELDSAGMDSESYDGDDQGRSEDEAYNHREPIVNLLPEQRLQKHRQSYEADIVVKLSMTDMLRTGKVLGLKLNVDTDFQPVVIKKVKKKGLAQDWNEANPRNQIHVGDEIVRVNDITWHHNSKTFVQRIKGQYLAARHKTAGASPFLALYIQRPRIDKRNRTHMQREDMHHKEYALDYVATLSMPGDSISANMLEGMGWTLGSQNNKSWHPLTILDIFSDGAIANYNEHHPNSLICPGDEIVGINNISWHENSTRFLGRLESQYQRSRSTPAGHARSFELSFRRPRDVQEMFDAAFPVVEKVRWDTDDIKVRRSPTPGSAQGRQDGLGAPNQDLILGRPPGSR
ncbi:unnamed protein product [Prorocentrum cordatum]|uniref:PDZ domain-containing protein n=1 Tax=Prorocentrum cordatum TaxID=2364126 RepID=A0ABN9XX76_9DINO|nr:unnamed protein product [Polarella glacialis]